MSLLAFIAELTKALAWPLVVVIPIFLFRPELQKLIARIKKGKIGSAEFEFEQDVQALAKEVENEGEERLSLPDPIVALLEVAKSDPRMAVIRAFLELEACAIRLASKKNLLRNSMSRTFSSATKVLHEAKFINSSNLSRMLELRVLRNQAVHDSEFDPSYGSVFEYLRLTNYFIGMLSAHHDAS
jgi:hypothetical protein